MFAGLHPEGTGHVSFTAAGSSGNEYVPVLGKVLASGKPVDQSFIEFPSGSIVDVSYTGISLLELGGIDPFHQQNAEAIAEEQ